jgi:hypothetical protein
MDITHEKIDANIVFGISKDNNKKKEDMEKKW